MSFLGYVRPDGKVGVRNHVIVIASVSCANGVVDGVTGALPEIKGITHTEGCGRGPQDLVTTTRTLAGLGKNPNVAAVLVVGLGCEFIKAPWVASEIQGSGKPTETLVIQGEGGSQATTRKAIEVARRLLDDASRVERREVGLDQLVVGLDCGDEANSAAKAVGACTDCIETRGRHWRVIAIRSREHDSASRSTCGRTSTTPCRPTSPTCADTYATRRRRLRTGGCRGFGAYCFTWFHLPARLVRSGRRWTLRFPARPASSPLLC